jgi:hypothetical protein
MTRRMHLHFPTHVEMQCLKSKNPIVFSPGLLISRYVVWSLDKVERSELLITRLPSLSLYKKLKVSPMGRLVDQASDIHT